ncbi:fluoride efflux transporter CrcB [Ferrimicrobium sp.]|uniref:fluoride efflux transporter CrcB n=1 Tax=Ferrimicrobium sp. TaxID=2926050 RepID=UPI0026124B39|nr:fluoride efflux transporter CrcB [Ferrimicrobium sp.]
MAWLLVVLFGALGAVVRYLLDRSIMRHLNTDFPVGTLMINLSGALALGIVVGLATRNLLPTQDAVAIGDGFIGAYTTFSTLTFESLSLANTESFGLGALNMVGTIVAATILAYLGIHIVQ